MTDSEVIFDANRRKQLESTLIGKYPVIELCDMDGLAQIFPHNLSLYAWKSTHACKFQYVGRLHVTRVALHELGGEMAFD